MGDVEEMIGELEEGKDDEETTSSEETRPAAKDRKDDDLELDLDSAWGTTERDED